MEEYQRTTLTETDPLAGFGKSTAPDADAVAPEERKIRHYTVNFVCPLLVAIRWSRRRGGGLMTLGCRVLNIRPLTVCCD